MFVMLVQRAERSITSSNEHVPTTYATDRERASSTAHTDTMAGLLQAVYWRGFGAGSC